MWIDYEAGAAAGSRVFIPDRSEMMRRIKKMKDKDLELEPVDMYVLFAKNVFHITRGGGESPVVKKAA